MMASKLAISSLSPSSEVVAMDDYAAEEEESGELGGEDYFESGAIVGD